MEFRLLFIKQNITMNKRYMHGWVCMAQKMENLDIYRARIHLAAYLNYLSEDSTLKLTEW